MNAYEAKQEARRERLERAAERARSRARAYYKRADMSEAATGIPFGQPILVGHHSERRHRRAIERADNAMRRSIAEDRRAADLAGRAASVGTGGISSDDPDAIEKLRAKLAKLEEQHEMEKQINAVIRKYAKHGTQAQIAFLEPLGFNREQAKQLLQPDFAGRIGIPAYVGQNRNANMKRIRDRIAHLERAATREHKEIEYANGVKLVQNVEENRLQIIFPGKPDADTRKKLKSYGFRWSPMAGAWQRQLSNAAIYAAKDFIA